MAYGAPGLVVEPMDDAAGVICVLEGWISEVISGGAKGRGREEGRKGGRRGRREREKRKERERTSMPARKFTPSLRRRSLLLPLSLETNRTSPLLPAHTIAGKDPRNRLQADDSPQYARSQFLDVVHSTSEAVEEDVGREGEWGVGGEEEDERDQLEEGES